MDALVSHAYLALGGNVGNSRTILDRAVTLLCDRPDLRLTARGYGAVEAQGKLEGAAALLRSAVGTFVYGIDGDDLAAVVLQLCRVGAVKVAVAESCTGGMLGARITAIPGSSDFFLGGTVAYSYEDKETHLGVRHDTLVTHGAVSEETAREMAVGACARFGADITVSITGIAGPGGGLPDKPVGTVCAAVDFQGEVRSARRSMVGDREEVRQRSAQWALDLMRRRLLGL